MENPLKEYELVRASEKMQPDPYVLDVLWSHMEAHRPVSAMAANFTDFIVDMYAPVGAHRAKKQAEKIQSNIDRQEKETLKVQKEPVKLTTPEEARGIAHDAGAAALLRQESAEVHDLILIHEKDPLER